MKRPPRGAFSFSWFGELETRTAVRQVREATWTHAVRPEGVSGAAANQSLPCNSHGPLAGPFHFPGSGNVWPRTQPVGAGLGSRSVLASRSAPTANRALTSGPRPAIARSTTAPTGCCSKSSVRHGGFLPCLRSCRCWQRVRIHHSRVRSASMRLSRH